MGKPVVNGVRVLQVRVWCVFLVPAAIPYLLLQCHGLVQVFPLYISNNDNDR
jgi:hypothetical protein